MGMGIGGVGALAAPIATPSAAMAGSIHGDNEIDRDDVRASF